MRKMILQLKMIDKYKKHLYEGEKSEATVNKYIRDIQSLYEFLPEQKELNKEILVAYKRSLSSCYKVSSINSMLIAINGFLEFMKLGQLKVKLYKVQREIFYQEDKELTKEEYKRLLKEAIKKDNQRLYMLLQTICGTGIRVSEHRYITVESLKEGRVMVNNKGKNRIVIINNDLKTVLLKYCRKQGITSGAVFVTRKGKTMDRSNIWTAMKKLCKGANVESKKVFPHNLRHLFALTYYRLYKDVVRLADILGHASIDTTRIYTMTSGKEYQKSLLKMNLVELFR